MKGEVRRMCAVDKEFRIPATAHLGKCRDVSGGAVIGGMQHPERLRVALGEGVFHHLDVQTVCDAESFVPARIQPDRTCTDLDQTGEHRLVGVARHQHRLTGPQHRQRGGDVPARRTLHQDETLSDAPRVGDQCLGFEDRTLGAVQGVGIGEIVQVDGGDVLTKPRVQRPTTFVARTVERRLVTLDEAPQSVEKRCGIVHYSP